MAGCHWLLSVNDSKWKRLCGLDCCRLSSWTEIIIILLEFHISQFQHWAEAVRRQQLSPRVKCNTKILIRSHYSLNWWGGLCISHKHWHRLCSLKRQCVCVRTKRWLTVVTMVTMATWYPLHAYQKGKIKCILTASERILRFIVLIKLALYLFYYSCFVCL